MPVARAWGAGGAEEEDGRCWVVHTSPWHIRTHGAVVSVKGFFFL